MDLEDYGQEENDTALHLCASRQRHKGQDNHRGSHCKCIILAEHTCAKPTIKS